MLIGWDCGGKFKMINSWNHTAVSPTHSRSIAQLWYDLRVLWLSIIHLEIDAKPFFSNYTNKYRLDPSKKLFFDPVSPRAAKLWALKVCSRRESNPGRPKSSDSLNKIAKCVASNPKVLGFFLTANFYNPQFCNPWSLSFEILST